MTITAIRKPDQVKAWQHKKGEKLPIWAKKGGISQHDLDMGFVAEGNWLVQKRGDVIVNMTPEHFAAEYEIG